MGKEAERDDSPRTIDGMMRALYDAYMVTERAVRIATAAPFHNYINDDATPDLVIDPAGEKATLHWVRAISDWDCPILEKESCDFPAELLTLSDHELAAWQKAEVARREDAAKKHALAAAEARRKKVADEAAAVVRDGVVVGGKRYKLVPQG